MTNSSNQTFERELPLFMGSAVLKDSIGRKAVIGKYPEWTSGMFRTFPYASRRDFVRALIGRAAGSCCLYSVNGQAPATLIKAAKLPNSLVQISGDSGNMGLILDADGLMVVDTGYPERGADLQPAGT